MAESKCSENLSTEDLDMKFKLSLHISIIQTEKVAEQFEFIYRRLQ